MEARERLVAAGSRVCASPSHELSLKRTRSRATGGASIPNVKKVRCDGSIERNATFVTYRKRACG